MTQISTKRDPVSEFLSRCRGVEESKNGHICWCPNHEADGESGGHQKSLSVSRGDDGRAIIHCFAGCDHREICHAVCMRVSELFPDEMGTGGRRKKSKRPRGSKAAEYEYRDSQGAMLYQAVRFEDAATGEKTFSQRRPNGDGGWIYNMKGVTRVLYRLPEILAADKSAPVFVVEGEKKADLLAAWGLLATCNVGGAGKWTKAYSDVLKGRPVIIFPDNDEPGLKHAMEVVDSSHGLARSVKVVAIPDLGPKEDVVDWASRGGTKDQLLQIVETSTGQELIADLEEIRQKEVEKRESNPLALEYAETRNDVGNGRRVIRDHGQELRYCHPWGKWVVWKDGQWRTDETGKTNRMAAKTVQNMREEVRMRGKDISDEMSRTMHEFVNRCSNQGPIDRMLAMAQYEKGISVMPYHFDNHPMLFNCANGTIELDRGVLREHRREDLLTKTSRVAFDPEAECPAWEKFLSSLFDRPMIEYLQRLCGYWATGVIREQILPIFYGSGANGKTTFLNTIAGVLGPDYSMKGAPEFLMAKKNEVHPTEKADLFGRRLVLCAETGEGRRMEESLVKEITGSERIRARRMREDFWEFEPTHKIVLATNHKPSVAGTDEGIWRRMRLIPFVKRFWDPETGDRGPDELRQNKNLMSELKSEYPGILTWIIRGCGEWLNFGEGTPSSVRSETTTYRVSQDMLGAFISECCEQGEYYSINASELYDSFRSWCELSGEYCYSQRRFGLAMTERGFEKYKSSSMMYRKIITIGKIDNSDRDQRDFSH